MKRWLIITLCVVVLLAIIGWFVLWSLSDNTTISTTRYTIEQERLPYPFSGFRIAQVADLHNTQFGDNNLELLTQIRNSEPDIIVFTGDLIDSRKTDLDVAITFAKEAVQIADCYYVRGNHEASTPLFRELEAELEALGVFVLADNWAVIHRDGTSITLLGLNDPTLASNYPELGSTGVVDISLKKLTDGIDTYTVLFAHQPQFLPLYAQHNIDLVLSGHAHGGQIRLDKHGGIIAPNQGFFPEYDAGVYKQGQTTLVLSRGLGNSLFPFRINNPPELVIVELVK